MKHLLSAASLAGALLAASAALAQGSTLQIGCAGKDVGAEVSIDGQFKGECPLEAKVRPGNIKLRLVKNHDGGGVESFEQDIRIGDGVVKKIDAVLSAPRAKGRDSAAPAQAPVSAVAARDDRPAPEVAAAAPIGASGNQGLGMPDKVAALPLGPVSTSFPSRPIRIVVPFAPGGTTDIMARGLAQQIGGEAGQPVIVDNRPGADSVIGSDLVAKAAPDGYTLLMAPSNLAINAGRYAELPFDAARGFAPVSMVGTSALVLLVNSGLNATSVRALIAHAKSNPGKLNFGSFSQGSQAHFATEWFKSATGVDLIHVPYKGGGQAFSGLLAGETQVMFAPISQASAQLSSGKLRALAVTSAQRSPQMPDVPTMAEAGVAGFEVLNWTALLAPAGTPPEVLNKLNQLAVRALNSQALKDSYAGAGMEVWAGSPEGSRSYINSEIDKYTRIAKAGGLQTDPGYGSLAAASAAPAIPEARAQTGASQEADAASAGSPFANAIAAAMINSLNTATASSLSQGGHTGLASMVSEMNNAMLAQLQGGDAGGNAAGLANTAGATGGNNGSGNSAPRQGGSGSATPGNPNGYSTAELRKAALACKASSTQNTGNPQIDTGCSLVAFDVCIYKTTGVTAYNKEAKAQCLILRETAKNMGGSGTACVEPCKAARLLPVD